MCLKFWVRKQRDDKGVGRGTGAVGGKPLLAIGTVDGVLAWFCELRVLLRMTALASLTPIDGNIV